MRSQSRAFPNSVFQASTSRLALWVLLGAGALSIVCYWAFFVRPFGLLDLAHRPLLDLFKLSQTDPAARTRVIAGYLVLGALYWLGWRAAQRVERQDARAAWLVVIASALIAAGVLLFMYPFGAADLFDNIMHGRILGIYHGNPFADAAAQFRGDPIYAFTAWKRTTSAYGPAWEVLAGGTAWLVHQIVGVSHPPRVSVVANAVAFKLLSGAFLAASAAVVALILRRKAPERVLAGVVLLAWNPVILVETLGNGHNDIAMIFWVLAAAWALVGGRYTLAVLALVVGALVKFVPVLMLPAAGLIAWRELGGMEGNEGKKGNEGKNGSRVRATRYAARITHHASRITYHVSRFAPRLRFLLITGAASVALIVLFYAPFWQGVETLSIERRQALFTASLPAAAWAALLPSLGKELTSQRVSTVAAVLTALFALWQGAQAWRDRSWLSFTRASFHIIMFYLLITCLWFQSWYAIWPLGLAALLPPGHAARLAALFGYVALAKPLAFEPLWLWHRPLPPKEWRELRLGPALMALPIVYALLAWMSERVRREKRESRETEGYQES